MHGGMVHCCPTNLPVLSTGVLGGRRTGERVAPDSFSVAQRVSQDVGWRCVLDSCLLFGVAIRTRMSEHDQHYAVSVVLVGAD